MDRFITSYDNYSIWQLSEIRYFSHSRVFVAKNMENRIIGAIRLMKWDNKEILPIQSLFGIQNLSDIFSEDRDASIWHIGRLAVSTDIGRYGLILFKLLLLYAMYPVCNHEKGIVLAECDSKLLRTMLLMGIHVKTLGEGVKYLGSETIPVYANRFDFRIIIRVEQLDDKEEKNISGGFLQKKSRVQ